jgi:RecB family exonuclease
MRSGSAPTSDLLVGRLVHRLLQHSVVDDHRVVGRARALVSLDEWVAVEDPDKLIDSAVDAWRAVRIRPEVVELLNGGRPYYEVPFALEEEGSKTILRGTIDCLVQKPDGEITIVEFKTGGRRAVHERQLSIYVRAAAILFPSSRVGGRLIYP